MRRFVILLAAALLVVGCSDDPPVEVVDIGTESGGLLVRNDPDYQADGASFVGVLTVEDGCVFLSSGSTEQTRTPVVWPHGTTWELDPPGLVLPGGRVVRLGEELSMGGGVGQRLRDEGLPPEVLDVLETCSEAGRLSIISLG